MLPTDGLVVAQNGGGGLAALLGGIVLFLLIVFLVLVVLPTVGMATVFAKAGQPWWAALVPVYNVYLLAEEIAEVDTLWLVLSFVGIGLVVVNVELAKKFGKGTGYGLGLTVLPFVCYPLLGFGGATYRGQSGAGRRATAGAA
jgi:hypothetical protein